MKKLKAIHRTLLAATIAMLPAATLLLDQLDRSMRRPSPVRALLSTLQFAF